MMMIMIIHDSWFKNFYDFRRPAEMSIKEFIIKYEALYHKLDEYHIQLPEGVQAFFVLTAANVALISIFHSGSEFL